MVGPSGSGKSTLALALAGLIPRDVPALVEGSLELGGRAVGQLDPTALAARVGLVFQDPATQLVMDRAEDDVAFGLENRAWPAERMHRRVPDALAAVGLRGFERRRSRRLSGGQQQRLALAGVLAPLPEVIVLDEPTANLDPAARKVLFDLLADRRGDPIIISSHRLEEVAGLVNRVVELDRGRVVLDDRVEDAGQLQGRQSCTLVIARPEMAFSRAVEEWGFRSSVDGLTWAGEVAAPDRLRFLGLLSRYAGIISSIRLEPYTEPHQLANGVDVEAKSQGAADAHRPLA